MRRTSGLLLLALLAGCVSAPEPPARGTAQVWGLVGGAPKEGLRSAAGGTGYYDESDGPALPAGAKLVDYRHIGPVVVQLRGPAPAPTGSTTVTLRDGAAAELQAVGAGGAIVIANRSGEERTVYARRGGETVFEVAVPAGADSSPQPAGATPGLLELFSYEAEGLAARVIVAGGPYRLVQGGERYVLSDLPPGRYTLEAWHPRLPPISRTLELAADQQLRSDLTFSVNRLPKVER